MSDTAKFIIIALMIFSGYFYSLYLTHNENLVKIEAESENRRIIANLKADKDLQNVSDLPVTNQTSVISGHIQP